MGKKRDFRVRFRTETDAWKRRRCTGKCGHMRRMNAVLCALAIGAGTAGGMFSVSGERLLTTAYAEETSFEMEADTVYEMNLEETEPPVRFITIPMSGRCRRECAGQFWSCM